MTTKISDAVKGIDFKSSATFPAHIKAPISKIKVEDVEFDYDYYQRLTNEAHAKRIHREFDPTFFMVPLVFRRKFENDKLVVVDGQQRFTAAYAGGVKHVDSVVIDSHSEAEEAQAFIKINHGRKAIPPAVLKKAQKTTGDKDAIDLIAAVELAGYTLHEKGGHLKLKAVTGIQKAFHQYGSLNITNALNANKAIWPKHPMVNADIIRGLAFLIWTFREKNQPGKVSAAKLAEMITNVDFKVIVNEIRRMRLNHQDRDYHVALELIKIYNRSAKLTGGSPLTKSFAYDAWIKGRG